jgi:ABC-type uncharacterized transport system involved in gliding motility auxiliary subunit/uncharacterized membrane protein YidH (DUF202 family)
MRPWASLVGWLGGVALAFAVVSFLIQLTSGSIGSELEFTLANLALGVLLLAAAAVASAGALRRRMGSAEAKRIGKYGTTAILGTLASVALVVAAVVLFSFPSSVEKLQSRWGVTLSKRWDWTEAHSNSLTTQSVEVLAKLPAPLEITAVYSPIQARDAKTLVELYQLAAPEKLKVEFVDPEKQPGRLRELAIASDRLAAGLLHVKLGKESTDVTELTEQALTSAIVKLTRSEKKRVYFLIGHNERPIEGDHGKDLDGFVAAADALRNENYEVATLLLAAAGDVPSDAQVVIAAGPTRPFHETEHAALERYVERGGALMLMFDPSANTDLTADATKWGVTVGNDMAIDLERGMNGRPATPFVEYVRHEITEKLRDVALFNTARSVRAHTAGKSTFTDLVQTSAKSWAETDVARMESKGEVEADDKDIRGPVPLGVAGELTIGDGAAAKHARLVVFGDSDFATNQLFHEFANGDLFLNSVNWLLGDVEAITVRPGKPRASRLQLSSEQFIQIRYLSLFVLPEVIAVLGVIAWWRRRRAPGR